MGPLNFVCAMNNRFRRLRQNDILRSFIQETRLSVYDFIQPFFVIEGKNHKEPISSMPGIFRFGVEPLLKAIEQYQKVGGRAGLFFGVVERKDPRATQAYNPDGLIPKAIKAIKKYFPRFLVMTDVCLCGYTQHGHCGIVNRGRIDNDPSIVLLAKMAVAHVQAGADIVAPSDMMDFRVKKIREELDNKGFQDTLILSYAVKYASAFYGPFREAAHSAPQFGDRKSYQMNPANRLEALKEAHQDVEEGADMVMVKPALAYLDIISLLKQKLLVPIVAYSVSGEYSMIKAAAQKKWINEREVVLESALSLKRAGADIIISYHAQDILSWLPKTL